MQTEIDMVLAFHRKHKFSEGRSFADDFNELTREEKDLLLRVGQELKESAESLIERALADGCEKVLLMRAHLIAEEVSEIFTAFGEGDEVSAIDGLTDSSYVNFGTGVSYDWPLEAALHEVQKSNMTKTKQPDDPQAARIRSKGPDYVAPDLVKVLQRHRERRAAETIAKTCPVRDAKHAAEIFHTCGFGRSAEDLLGSHPSPTQVAAAIRTAKDRGYQNADQAGATISRYLRERDARRVADTTPVAATPDAVMNVSARSAYGGPIETPDRSVPVREGGGGVVYMTRLEYLNWTKDGRPTLVLSEQDRTMQNLRRQDIARVSGEGAKPTSIAAASKNGGAS